MIGPEHPHDVAVEIAFYFDLQQEEHYDDIIRSIHYDAADPSHAVEHISSLAPGGRSTPPYFLRSKKRFRQSGEALRAKGTNRRAGILSLDGSERCQELVQ